MSTKIFVALLLLLSVFSPSVRSQTEPDSIKESVETAVKTESTAELRRKTFETVWQTINETHFDPNFNGVDWNKIKEKYQPLAAGSENNDNLFGVLNQMLRELHQSHFQIIDVKKFLAAQKNQTGGIGVEFRIIDGQAVIVKVAPDSPAARAGIRQGFVVTTIDRETTESIAAPIKETSLLPANHAASLAKKLNSKTYGQVGTEVRLTYRDEKNKKRELMLRREKRPGEFYKQFGAVDVYVEFEAKRLENNIGYIRFTDFMQGIEDRLFKSIRSMKDAPAVILDLRGNGGGFTVLENKLAGMFIEKPGAFLIKRVTRAKKAIDFTDFTFAQNDGYKGKLVILLDGLSASASESIAAGLQEAGRAIVVGERSEGSLLEAGINFLPNGFVLLHAFAQPVTPKGVVIEGRGVIPDVEIKRTRENLLKGGDVQLETVILRIKSKITK